METIGDGPKPKLLKWIGNVWNRWNPYKKRQPNAVFFIFRLEKNLSCGFFSDDHFGHFIALADGVNHLQSFHHPTEAGMVSIQMGSIVSAVTHKKLGPTCISSGMSHGKNTSVVELVATGQFAIYFITRSTSTCSGWIAALNHKIRNDAMEGNAIVKAFFGKVYKIFHGIGGILIVKFDLHHTLFGMDFSGCHML